LDVSRQTGGQTDIAKLIVGFRKFAKAPLKKETDLLGIRIRTEDNININLMEIYTQNKKG
jgi:hypothetical protein